MSIYCLNSFDSRACEFDIIGIYTRFFMFSSLFLLVGVYGLIKIFLAVKLIFYKQDISFVSAVEWILSKINENTKGM